MAHECGLNWTYLSAIERSERSNRIVVVTTFWHSRHLAQRYVAQVSQAVINTFNMSLLLDPNEPSPVRSNARRRFQHAGLASAARRSSGSYRALSSG
jgi:hypothetical protein